MHCNVLLMSENRPPILDITYRAFSSIYGWTCSRSFYSLRIHLSYWPFIFSRCFSLFDFLILSAGDGRQQLTWGREGFDFKGELDLNKQPLKSISGEEVGTGKGYLPFLRSFL